MHGSHLSLSPLRNLAAQYLAAALTDLFPQALLVQGGGTHYCFYYDVCFPFAFQATVLPLIEERMRSLCHQGEGSLHLLEMVPSNAAERLSYEGQRLLAHRIRQVMAPLVQMCQIGQRVFPCAQPVAAGNSLKYFKLLCGVEQPRAEGKQVIRLVGIVAENKEALKGLVRQKQDFTKNHSTSTDILRLFAPLPDHHWMWLPAGEKMRASWYAWWQKECMEKNISLLSTPYTDEVSLMKAHMRFLSQLPSSSLCMLSGEWTRLFHHDREEEIAEGLFSTVPYFTDRTYLLCAEEKLEEGINSSLQFIQKIPRILRFDFEVVVSLAKGGEPQGKKRIATVLAETLSASQLKVTTQSVPQRGMVARVDLLFYDALGRRWAGPFLSFPSRSLLGVHSSSRWLLVRSAFGSMERLMGLVIEHGEQGVLT